MEHFFNTTTALIGQFTSFGGGVDKNIVQFVLAGTSWALLLWFAIHRRQKKHIIPHESLLIVGFGFGVLREAFMLTMALLEAYGIVANETLHIFFPPLEHALLDYAMVIICAAYMKYLVRDISFPRRFLIAGVSAVSICYLATFIWWARFIMAHPDSRFGLTWCDWIFRFNSSVFIAVALVYLFPRTRGWVRNVVSLALLFFFLNEFLKIPDMAFLEAYEAQITPFRHGFYLLGIPLLGYIYVREQFELEDRTEKALQKSEALYRSLVENIDLGITLIDADHTILMANRAQHRIFNKPAGHFTGKKCFREFEKQDSVCAHCPGTRAMKTGQPQEADVENFRDDGTRFKVRIKAFPVPDADGRITSFIEVVEDITERLRIEEELQQSRNLESIGLLAGGIAHDFNNILASIFGFTDLAKLKNRQNADITKELIQISRASQRARDLVQQILTISRKQQRQKKPLAIGSLIKETLKLLRSSIPSTIDIRQNISAEGIIEGDETQINQLVMNLCTNAYQAMAEPGGTLTVSLKDKVISPADSLVGEHVLAPGSYVVLEVSDTGPGIDPAVKDKIFEPYFTTKAKGRGTGLGLAVVHGIVKSHQGRISVHSETGVGTTFFVYLPVIEGEASASQGTEEEFYFSGSQRLMIIDDEEDIRTALTEYLDKFGFSVDVFSNGKEAWEAFAENPEKWDLIITDQTMPEMTGSEFISRARELKPDLPIIFCSGYSETITTDLIEKLEVSAYLEKPVAMNDLFKAIAGGLKAGPPEKADQSG